MYLRRKVWLLVPLIGLALACAAEPANARPGMASTGGVTVYLPLIRAASVSFAQQVIALVNQERAKQSCPALSSSPQLSAAAQAHSQDMALNNIFSHSGSDGSSPWARMTAAGYSFSMAAENIAAGQPTPAAVMDAWMNSAGHRSHILDCSLRDIGVGFYDQLGDQANVRLDGGALGGPYRYYWTQDFGTP